MLSHRNFGCFAFGVLDQHRHPRGHGARRRLADAIDEPPVGEEQHPVGMIKTGPHADQRAAIVADQAEPIMAERLRDRHDVIGHGALGVGLGIVGDGLVAGPVAAQVRHHHREARRQRPGTPPQRRRGSSGSASTGSRS